MFEFVHDDSAKVFLNRGGNTIEENSKCLLPNLNALVAISKGIRAVKLCSNIIFQLLTGGAG